MISDSDQNISDATTEVVQLEGISLPRDDQSFFSRLRNFLMKWHLPIFFVIVLTLGYAFPIPGTFLQDANLGGICLTNEICVLNRVSDLSIFVIFIVSGIKLESQELKAAFVEWKVIIFGVISILLLSPLISLATIHIPFGVSEFAVGISLFFAQSTSLSSGPTIAAQANGNVALALLLTVVTNTIGVLTMPLFVVAFLKRQETKTDFEIETIPIVVQLICLIIVPCAIGKLLRFSSCLLNISNKHSESLKIFSSMLLSLIIWLNVSASKADLASVSFIQLLPLFIPAILIHLLTLGFNYVVLKLGFSKLAKGEQRSVLIMTSCKSLSVALTVLQLLDEEAIGSKGLVAIPMIICHFAQVILDSCIAAKWAHEKEIEELSDRSMADEDSIHDSDSEAEDNYQMFC